MCKVFPPPRGFNCRMANKSVNHRKLWLSPLENKDRSALSKCRAGIMWRMPMEYAWLACGEARRGRGIWEGEILNFECQIFEGKFSYKKNTGNGKQKRLDLWTNLPSYLVWREKRWHLWEKKSEILKNGVSCVGVWLTTNQNDLNNLSTQQSGLELVQGRIYSGGVCNDDGTQSSGRELRFEENGKRNGQRWDTRKQW